MTISPSCLVNGSATPPAIAVAGGSTVTIALANPSGVQYWSISCTSTDELNTAAAINATLVVNMGAKTATFTAPAGLGSAVIFTSTVGISNIGIDQNKVVQPSFSTTFKVNVATSGSAVVMAANETLEQLATFGWIGLINAFIRSGGGGGGGGIGFTGVVAVSANFAGLANKFYQVSAGSPIAATMPTLTNGQMFGYADVLASSNTNPITFTPPGGIQLMNPATLVYGAAGAPFVANVNGASAQWMSDGSTHYYAI